MKREDMGETKEYQSLSAHLEARNNFIKAELRNFVEEALLYTGKSSFRISIKQLNFQNRSAPYLALHEIEDDDARKMTADEIIRIILDRIPQNAKQGEVYEIKLDLRASIPRIKHIKIPDSKQIAEYWRKRNGKIRCDAKGLIPVSVGMLLMQMARMAGPVDQDFLAGLAKIADETDNFVKNMKRLDQAADDTVVKNLVEKAIGSGEVEGALGDSARHISLRDYQKDVLKFENLTDGEAKVGGVIWGNAAPVKSHPLGAERSLPRASEASRVSISATQDFRLLAHPDDKIDIGKGVVTTLCVSAGESITLTSDGSRWRLLHKVDCEVCDGAGSWSGAFEIHDCKSCGGSGKVEK